MDETTYQGAIANCENRDFAIRLPNGLMLVCWSQNTALGEQRHALLDEVLKKLDEAKALPDLINDPSGWPIGNICFDGLDDAIHISDELGLSYYRDGFDDDRKLEAMIDLILAAVTAHRKNKLIKLFWEIKKVPSAPAP